MGKNTGVPWATHSWNPWWGCEKLADRRECDACYAELFARRVGRSCWGPKAERRCASPKVWGEPYAWDRAAFESGKQASVFCMSMGDIFEPRSDLDELRERAWLVIRETPALTWLLLSKRVEWALEGLLPYDLRYGRTQNVLLGATVGTQHAADHPKPVDFISCEPLLERVDITPWMTNRLRCVIIGGESRGSKPGRECREEWVRDIIGQCRPQGVSVFVKQLHIAGKLVHDVSQFPEDLRIRNLAWEV